MSTAKDFALSLRGSCEADSTRVYTRTGVVVHLLPSYSSPNSNDAALCGTEPGEYWYGTGTQDEYELAERLPLCRGCERASA